MYYGMMEMILKMQIEEGERLSDELYLKTLLDIYPPEKHAEVREENRKRIAERHKEREIERRHQELIGAIERAGRYEKRGYY
jgi:hypothetical protein